MLGRDLVNPGAYEVGDNQLDDDCDGDDRRVGVGLRRGLPSASTDALDFAKSLDLCQTTEEDPADPAESHLGRDLGRA